MTLVIPRGQTAQPGPAVGASRAPQRPSRDSAAAWPGLRGGPAGTPRRPNTREARWQPRAIGLPSDKPLRVIDATPERHRGWLERHRVIRT